MAVNTCDGESRNINSKKRLNFPSLVTRAKRRTAGELQESVPWFVSLIPSSFGYFVEIIPQESSTSVISFIMEQLEATNKSIDELTNPVICALQNGYL